MIHNHYTSQLRIVSSNHQHASQQLRTWVHREWSLTIDTSPYVIWANTESESLTIEAVRLLQQQLSYRAVGELQLVICPGIDSASLPAQQALLKLLEEPPTATQIILTASGLGTVLTTIQSRCNVSYLDQIPPTNNHDTQHQELDMLYQQLTQGTVANTIALAGKYSTKADALEVTRQLLDLLHQRLPTLGGAELAKTTQHLASLVLLNDQLQHNTAPRLALEHIWLGWLTA